MLSFRDEESSASFISKVVFSNHVKQKKNKVILEGGVCLSPCFRNSNKQVSTLIVREL